MTRIRRHWSSSRGAEEPEPPPRLPHVVDTDEADIDTKAKPASRVMLQLADEDAVLAAVSLKALEHDVAGINELEQETTPSTIWEQLVLGGLSKQGRSDSPLVIDGGLSKLCRSDSRCRKISGHSDCELDSEPNGKASNAKEVVDEVQSKSSSAADDKVDSDMSVEVAPVVEDFSAGPKLEDVFLDENGVGRDEGIGDTLRVPRLILGGRAGRKKRQRPWESDSDPADMTASAGYMKTQRADTDVNDEVVSKDDRNNLRPKLENATEDRGVVERSKIKIRAKFRMMSMGDGNKTMAKSEKRKGDAQKLVTDSFPLGWKYRGLAQIAEKDRAARTREDRCGRTDGRLWQCPLKKKEGFSLCEHHLNKFRLKKLYKHNERAKLQNSDARLPISPQTSDSTFKPSTPLDYDTDARTKFRRRHKTAKLSVL